MDLLAIVLRWTHIASMSFLIGGVLYARLVLYPSLDSLAEIEREKLGDRIAGRFRAWVAIAVGALLISGLMNLMRKSSLPPGFHMWFGIKMLLAFHVIAVSLLLGRSGVAIAKRRRWLTGIAASGLAVLAVSAWLRSMQ
jgi:uncharacterized membrane protein